MILYIADDSETNSNEVSGQYMSNQNNVYCDTYTTDMMYCKV